MHTGLMMVTESERDTGLRMRLEHITTELNSVPDMLSRGAVERAKALVVKRWSKCIKLSARLR